MDSKHDSEDPVVAYALATGALLAAACLMCIILMCCAKCPEWRRRRRQRKETETLLSQCSKIKFSSRYDSKNGTPSDTCAVCLEDFKDKEVIMVCPCRHGYHKHCLSDWIVHSPCCPMCKALISSSTSLAKPSAATPTESSPLLA